MSTRPAGTETPEKPGEREHPSPRPGETPRPTPADTPEDRTADGHAPDPIDARLWALTYRSAEMVGEILQRLDAEPEGRWLDELTLEVQSVTGHARSTIRNTFRELDEAGIIHRAEIDGEPGARLTPVGRAWTLCCIDVTRYPLPRIILRTEGEHRLVWQRPTAAMYETTDPNTGNPTHDQEVDHR